MSLIKNKTSNILLISIIFETLGTSLFNIILLNYAKSFPEKNLFVSIVSVGTFIPSLMGYIMGNMSDKTKNKSNKLILVKIIQSILFLMLSEIITNKTKSIFFLIILINIISDTLSLYSFSLRLPIIKKNISDNNYEKFMGLVQIISSLLQPLGQSFGVIIIERTNNFALAGYINSILFLLSGIILFLNKKSINYKIKKRVKLKKINNFYAIKYLKGNYLLLLIYLFIINSMGAGIESGLNLFILDNKKLFSLTFSVCLLIINITFLFGVLLGSLVNVKKIFNNIYNIMIFLCISLMNLYLVLIFSKKFFLINLCIFCISFLLSNLNPKLYSMLLKSSNSNNVGKVTGLVNSVITISAPIGSIFVIILYNTFSSNISFLSCFILILITFISLLFFSKKELNS